MSNAHLCRSCGKDLYQSTIYFNVVEMVTYCFECRNRAIRENTQTKATDFIEFLPDKVIRENTQAYYDFTKILSIQKKFNILKNKKNKKEGSKK